MEGSITRAGVIFLMYLFIMVILVYTLYTPINSIFDGFLGIDDTSFSDELDTYIPLYSDAFTIVCLIAITTPIVWFIFWIFSDETTEVVRR